MKAFRNIVFIPVVLILIIAVYGGLIGLAWLMGWTMTLNLQNLLWIKIVVGVLFGLSCINNLRGSILMSISIYFLFFVFLKWLLGMGFWEILFFLIIFNWGWALLKLLTTVFSALTSMISPNKEFGYWTVFIIGILQAIFAIYYVWAKGLGIVEGNKVQLITLLIFVSIGILTLTFRLIIGAITARHE